MKRKPNYMQNNLKPKLASRTARTGGGQVSELHLWQQPADREDLPWKPRSAAWPTCRILSLTLTISKAKQVKLGMKYQKKLKATEPNNYTGKVSEETEDIIKKEENKNSSEPNRIFPRIFYVLI
ncbi:hypothetical protein HPG69_007796 [Diceros bicornis minor]|uniref:Uncharacterized protein n=1 Tax=Diceros bicornis minor TaxID=77932 RepID=A0A7J7EBM4_DICBM|nr:hypothetical protein HPG69_007796 [Diceros bicornis minor]